MRPGNRFYDYAILGDDLVIADSEVAKEYLRIMEDCEVSISKEKSLISSTGACEFAKRFRIKNCTVDVSPVSFKVLNMFGRFAPGAAFHALSLNYRKSIRRRGGGYRCYSRSADHFPVSKKWKRHWLSYHFESIRRNLRCTDSATLALKLFLTMPDRGALDPYRYGVIHHMIVRRLRPKDFKDLESLARISNSEPRIFEQLLKGWLEQHLEYTDWYYQVALDLNTPIERVLQKNLVCYSWKRNALLRKELEESHYGLRYNAYDLYGSMVYVPLALDRLDGHTLKLRRN